MAVGLYRSTLNEKASSAIRKVVGATNMRSSEEWRQRDDTDCISICITNWFVIQSSELNDAKILTVQTSIPSIFSVFKRSKRNEAIMIVHIPVGERLSFYAVQGARAMKATSNKLKNWLCIMYVSWWKYIQVVDG